MAVSTPSRRRVVLLAGPSGSGKSRLASRLHAEHGWPVVRLDDFYRDADDPSAPVHPRLGIVDWDDPRSWDGVAAADALEALVDSGSCEVPTYDIATSHAIGRRTVTARPGDLVLAEGIFAAELAQPLRERGLLLEAWCLRHPRPVTFVRRLARDLAERRKPPLVLLRRGVTLMRDEATVLERQLAAGAVVARPGAVERDLGTRAPGVG